MDAFDASFANADVSQNLNVLQDLNVTENTIKDFTRVLISSTYLLFKFTCSNFALNPSSGIDIAKRRRETIAKELSGYQKCLDNIKNKLDMTTELEEGIVEELTEEDIKRSRCSLNSFVGHSTYFIWGRSHIT